jgi:flagellar assembly factor FliW
MNDTRIMKMQIIQPFQNLLRSVLQSLNRNMFMFLPILSRIPTCTNLSDKIQCIMIVISPKIIKSNDVFVCQASKQPYFKVKSTNHIHCRTIVGVSELNLISSYFYSFFLIKCFVYFLTST